jgi:hypothetical protein
MRPGRTIDDVEYAMVAWARRVGDATIVKLASNPTIHPGVAR